PQQQQPADRAVAADQLPVLAQPLAPPRHRGGLETFVGHGRSVRDSRAGARLWTIADRAPVAQPDRVVASEAIGRGFESLQARQSLYFCATCTASDSGRQG